MNEGATAGGGGGRLDASEGEASRSAEDPPPFYDLHVFCCVNERAADHPRGCCLAKGSKELRDYMKARVKELGLGRIRINASGCLDRCELGPSMVIYPEGVWYHYRSRADVDEILETHVRQGGRVRRLMLQRKDRKPPSA